MLLVVHKKALKASTTLRDIVRTYVNKQISTEETILLVPGTAVVIYRRSLPTIIFVSQYFRPLAPMFYLWTVSAGQLVQI